jgi:DNA replication regulator DPB11
MLDPKARSCTWCLFHSRSLPFVINSEPLYFSGINLSPIFSRRSTHLLCPSRTGAKFDKAREWDIPVIDMAWLAKMATARVVPPVSGYLAHPPVEHSTTFDEWVWEDRSVEEPKVTVKVKGKDVDYKINNITNGKSAFIFRLILRRLIEGNTDGEPDDPMLPIPVELQKEHPEERRNAHLVPFSLQEGAEGTANSGFGPLSQHQQPSKITPALSNRSLEYATRPNSLTSSAHNSTSAGTAHRPTPGEIDRDRKQVRIPSSMSPSPMKIPRNGNGFRASPAKVSNEVTKALQDSITLLLGKRQPSEEDEIVARTGKRARPHRSKVPYITIH